MSSTTETRSFEVDRDIIWSLVFRQNKSLVGAMLELIQNSFDAEATKVDIHISETGFSVKDNGKGFSSRDQIESWFEVFGFGDKEVDDNKFGRFRMGRGQIMGHSTSTWRSGLFKMEVDIKNQGLNYKLHTETSVEKGCSIVGNWYEPLSTQHEFRHYDKNAENSITRFCELLSKRLNYMVGIEIRLNNVFINDYGKKDCIYEDDYFYFLKNSDIYTYGNFGSDISLFNLGIHVGNITVKRLVGDVITKKHMKLNLSRSEVQTDCPVLQHIKTTLRKLAPKYDIKKKYTANGASDVILDYINGDASLAEIQDLKLFQDIRRSKHYSLKDLSSKPFIISPRDAKGKSLADNTHTEGQYLVLHEEHGFFIAPDNMKYKGPFPHLLQKYLNLFSGTPEEHSLIYSLGRNYLDTQSVFQHLNLERIELDPSSLPMKTKAKLHTLNLLNYEMGKMFDENLKSSRTLRQFCVGLSSELEAWTDCETKIVIEQSILDLMDSGFEGVIRLVMVIAHEYAHIKDDSLHDVSFYERFHDRLQATNLFGLSKLILKKYDDKLAKENLKATANVKKAMKLCRRDGLSMTIK